MKFRAKFLNKRASVNIGFEVPEGGIYAHILLDGEEINGWLLEHTNN